MLDAKQLVKQYSDEFFKQNDLKKSNSDVIKLLSDEKKLCKQYLTGHVDFDEIYFTDRPLFNVAYKVHQFIEQQKRLPCDKRSINQLMVAVSRIAPLGSFPEDVLNEAEKKVNSLLSMGLDINATDSYGRTALMYVVLGEDIFEEKSIRKGRERFARLLLEKGADPSIKDYLGKSALDYFREYAGIDHPSVEIIEEAINRLESSIPATQLHNESRNLGQRYT